MKKGDIVLVDFPFTDFSESKLRPAVVLLANKFDYVICFITSNLSIREKFDLLIIPNQTNGLKKQSVLKLGRVMTVEKDIVTGRIGSLTTGEIRMLNKNMISLYQLGNGLH